MPGAEMAKEPPPAKRSTSRLGMYGLLMGYIFSIKVPSPPPPPPPKPGGGRGSSAWPRLRAARC